MAEIAVSSTFKELDKLVGTWNVYGDAQGQVTYEWMEGGFFLIQRVDLVHDGRRHKGIEIIGHERVFGADAPVRRSARATMIPRAIRWTMCASSMARC